MKLFEAEIITWTRHKTKAGKWKNEIVNVLPFLVAGTNSKEARAKLNAFKKQGVKIGKINMLLHLDN